MNTSRRAGFNPPDGRGGWGRRDEFAIIVLVGWLADLTSSAAHDAR